MITKSVLCISLMSISFLQAVIEPCKAIRCFECSYTDREACSGRHPDLRFLKQCPPPKSKNLQSTPRSICGIWTFFQSDTKRPGFLRLCTEVSLDLPTEKKFLSSGFFEKTIKMNDVNPSHTTNNFLFICTEDNCNDHEVAYDFDRATVKYKTHNPQGHSE